MDTDNVITSSTEDYSMYIYTAIIAVIGIGIFYLYRYYNGNIPFLSFMKRSDTVDGGYNNSDEYEEYDEDDDEDDNDSAAGDN